MKNGKWISHRAAARRIQGHPQRRIDQAALCARGSRGPTDRHGQSRAEIAEFLPLDEDTIRGFYRTFVTDGLKGLERFESAGSSCDLRIPTKPAMPSRRKPATCSDSKPAGIPISRRPPSAVFRGLAMRSRRGGLVKREVDFGLEKAEEDGGVRRRRRGGGG